MPNKLIFQTENVDVVAVNVLAFGLLLKTLNVTTD